MTGLERIDRKLFLTWGLTSTSAWLISCSAGVDAGPAPGAGGSSSGSGGAVGSSGSGGVAGFTSAGSGGTFSSAGTTPTGGASAGSAGAKAANRRHLPRAQLQRRPRARVHRQLRRQRHADDDSGIPGFCDAEHMCAGTNTNFCPELP